MSRRIDDIVMWLDEKMFGLIHWVLTLGMGLDDDEEEVE